MSRIPLNVKVSLINNYIQHNYLRSRGKAEHEDWMISDILNEIIEDLKALDKERTTEHVPLGYIVNNLKSYRDSQTRFETNIKSTIASVIKELKSLQETEENTDEESKVPADQGPDLDKIIKDLEDLSSE